MRVNFSVWKHRALAAMLFLGLGGAAAYGQSPTACGQTTWDLTAGQTIKAGTVTVCNDATNLYVTYTINTVAYPNATFGELHMWAGTALENLPGGGTARPAPGQLCQALGGACFDATGMGLTTYTFTIPLTKLNIPDVTLACNPPTSLYVVTHAEVFGLKATDPGSHETAFGGPTAGPGNAWWFYGQYAICCPSGDPGTGGGRQETAFAKGGWVWTTDKKSNPENLPSLSLTKNRWGWAINLTAPGVTQYDVWAGAGLNVTAKATKVGTLTVNWDGSNAIVTYNLFQGFKLEEVHIYANDARPTTLAPGQYGFLAAPGGTTFSQTLPLADTNGKDGVWLIAHAVVSGNF